jgi:hypothetical protein
LKDFEEKFQELLGVLNDFDDEWCLRESLRLRERLREQFSSQKAASFSQFPPHFAIENIKMYASSFAILHRSLAHS